MFGMMSSVEPTDAFEWAQADGRPALICRALQPIAEHLYTTRHWALGAAAASEPAGAWDQVAHAIGVDGERLVRLRQVHGAEAVVRKAGAADTPRVDLPEADIVVSDDPSLALAIQTADCVPLLIADTRSGVVGAAHAGWRGLAAGVPAVAVRTLIREFGSSPADLIAAAGPSISAARYEVGEDVRQRFESGGFGRAELERWFRPGVRERHWQFDGWQATSDQLAAAGVPPGRIFVASLCTANDAEHFCSYRRDGSPAGRMAAVIRPRRCNPDTVDRRQSR
jgi:YfiH family protein